MIKSSNNSGFSLAEVLLAVGILAVGMAFVAGVFPVGMHLTTIASERTIAALVADEAFAKIRLYAEGNPENSTDDIDMGRLFVNELLPNELRPQGAVDFDDIFRSTNTMNVNEKNNYIFSYPSCNTASQKQYYWQALFRRTSAAGNLIQATVFVCRKTGPVQTEPVRVAIDQTGVNSNELRIRNFGQKGFISDGCTIVDDETGRIYCVLERYPHPDDAVILLDRDWAGTANNVWVVSPPVGGGRYPCIAVYQQVIGF